MNENFDFITTLQYRVKALTSQLRAFESGEKYLKMKSEFMALLKAKDREIKRLENELYEARIQAIQIRQNYQEVIEDLENENEKQQKKSNSLINKLKEKILRLERIIDETKNRLSEKVKELYQVKTELEEEKDKNQKLKAQINRDYENSSIPSSLKINKKKIENGREKTGRKPGAQLAHKGHPRKKQEPTNKTLIPPPEEYLNNPHFKPTGKTVTKQLIDIRLKIIVNEF